MRQQLLQVLLVCTGNICRSPLAEQVLVHRLADLEVRVESVGTRARAGTPMTAEAISTCGMFGVPSDHARRHAARRISEDQIEAADLVVTMTRAHRREVVELFPASSRKCFTVRELGRLMGSLPADALERVTVPASILNGDLGQSRMTALLARVSAQRGIDAPSIHHDKDDVVDPYRQSYAIYEQSAEQMMSGLVAVETIVRAALL